MRVNGYRCDWCGKEHLIQPYEMPRDYGEKLPPEWYVVNRASDLGKKEPLVFCRAECLYGHIRSVLEGAKGEQTH